MNDKYSINELGAMLKAHIKGAETTYDDFNSKLTEIKYQTVKTNGRVKKLELWQAYILGFCACLTLLVLPFLWMMLKIYL